MRRVPLVLSCVLLSLALSACVVAPRRAGIWVPGHYGPAGVWVHGHYR